MPLNPNDPGRSYYAGGGLTGGAFGAPGGRAAPMGGGFFGGGPVHVPFATVQQIKASPGVLDDFLNQLNWRGYTMTPQMQQMAASLKTSVRRTRVAAKPQKPAQPICTTGG